MDNRSVNDIKSDVDIKMKSLGKLIILRRLFCNLSIIFTFISICSFVFIFLNTNILIPGIVCIMFMILSLVAVLLYVETANICLELKRDIHNDNKILERLTK